MAYLFAVAPRRLSDSEVLSQLQHKYQAPVMAHIQDQSSSLSRRQEPIIPDANGVVEELGQCLNLEGYAVFALRALIGLLVLQSRRCVPLSTGRFSMLQKEVPLERFFMPDLGSLFFNHLELTR
jgi:hypothetical protein